MSNENERSLLRANEYAQAFVKKPAHAKFQFADQVFSGGLNDNFVFISNSISNSISLTSNKFILRVPKSDGERNKTIKVIDREFNAMGLLDLGVSYRLRSIPEQAEFIYNAYLQGFKVLPYSETESQTMLTTFIEGISLDKYIQSERFDFGVVRDVLSHLTEAHRHGVVFGDRWVTNTFVLTNNDFVEMDFDIELVGDHTTISSFELAQTLYNLIHFSGSGNRSTIKNALIDFYKENVILLKHYDLQKLTSFLSGYAELFRGKFEGSGELYEGIVPPYQEIYDLIESLQIILQGN